MNIQACRDDDFGQILSALNGFYQYKSEEVTFTFDTIIGVDEKHCIDRLAMVFHEAQSGLETNVHAHLNPFAQSMFDLWVKSIDTIKIEEANKFIPENERPSKLSFTVVIGRDRKNFGPYYFFNVEITAVKKQEGTGRFLNYPVATINIILSRQYEATEIPS